MAVAACTMTLSVLSSDDGEGSSWQIRLPLVQGTGGRESWRSNEDVFRALRWNAIIVKITGNKGRDCKDSSSAKGEG